MLDHENPPTDRRPNVGPAAETEPPHQHHPAIHRPEHLPKAIEHWFAEHVFIPRCHGGSTGHGPRIPAGDRPDQDRTRGSEPVSYTHLRAHETVLDLVCRLLLEKKKKKTNNE